MTRKLFSILAAAALAVGVASPANAAPAWDNDSAWVNAASWLEGELVDGVLLGPSFVPGMPGSPDWGMTIDMLIAVRASKLQPQLAQALADKIAANVDSYATSADWGDPDDIDGGATAKLLFAAVAAGADPLDFDGHHMRQRTLDLLDANGWVRDSNDASFDDVGNMFDQSLAVLGLAGSGGVPDNAVQFLLKQQCDDGGFPNIASADPTGDCASSTTTPGASVPVPHIDATAMAIQALYAAGKTEAAGKAVTWLAGMQQPNGGFDDTWDPAPATNSNSTGLAGQALFAGGKTEHAEKAAQYVRSLQLTAANAGAANAEVGAIGWDAEALADAKANGISEAMLDTWHRATTQAPLAITKVPMHRIGVDSPPSPPPASSTSPASGGSGGGLPVTGPAVTTVTLVGAAILLTGGLLVVLTRRRRDAVQ